MSDLKPCPFPHKIEFGVHLREAGSRHAGWNYTVECKDCGADGPYAMTENAAITAWNTRAAPKVKPLEWEEGNGRWASGGGNFRIALVDGRFCLMQHSEQNLWFDTLEAAKNTAWSIHKTYIYASLALTPETET